MNQPQNHNIKLASRKRRIAAIFIDHFAISVLGTVMIFSYLGTDFINATNAQDQINDMVPAIIVGILIYLCKDFIKGISFGKWIMGIMIRDEHHPEEIPSMLRLFLRNLLLIIYPIEFIVLASSAKKQRIGDLVTKTVVLRNPKKQARLPRIVGVIAIGLCFVVFTVFFAGSAMKSSDAYKVAIEHIEKNEKIEKETGGITGYGIMPTGNINITNGVGEANLRITVKGVENDLSVGAYLTKSPNGEWKMRKLYK